MKIGLFFMSAGLITPVAVASEEQFSNITSHGTTSNDWSMYGPSNQHYRSHLNAWSFGQNTSNVSQTAKSYKQSAISSGQCPNSPKQSPNSYKQCPTQPKQSPSLYKQCPNSYKQSSSLYKQCPNSPRQCPGLKKDLDVLMDVKGIQNPELLRKYRSAREIIDRK